MHAFVNLRECELDEGGCTAEQCGYPHPEDSARSAEADCRGYTDDVARADTRRGRDHECAERGMLPSLSGFSMMTLHASLNGRIWMNLQRNVK